MDLTAFNVMVQNSILHDEARVRAKKERRSSVTTILSAARSSAGVMLLKTADNKPTGTRPKGRGLVNSELPDDIQAELSDAVDVFMARVKEGAARGQWQAMLDSSTSPEQAAELLEDLFEPTKPNYAQIFKIKLPDRPAPLNTTDNVRVNFDYLRVDSGNSDKTGPSSPASPSKYPNSPSTNSNPSLPAARNTSIKSISNPSDLSRSEAGGPSGSPRASALVHATPAVDSPSSPSSPAHHVSSPTHYARFATQSGGDPQRRMTDIGAHSTLASPRHPAASTSGLATSPLSPSHSDSMPARTRRARVLDSLALDHFMSPQHSSPEASPQNQSARSRQQSARYASTGQIDNRLVWPDAASTGLDSLSKFSAERKSVLGGPHSGQRSAVSGPAAAVIASNHSSSSGSVTRSSSVQRSSSNPGAAGTVRRVTLAQPLGPQGRPSASNMGGNGSNYQGGSSRLGH